jgi:hypothetical protein
MIVARWIIERPVNVLGIARRQRFYAFVPFSEDAAACFYGARRGIILSCLPFYHMLRSNF